MAKQSGDKVTVYIGCSRCVNTREGILCNTNFISSTERFALSLEDTTLECTALTTSKMGILGQVIM